LRRSSRRSFPVVPPHEDAHLEVIMQRLGHSSIRVTSDVYGSVLPAVDEAVTEGLEARFGGSCGADVVQSETRGPGR
jgi:integrase